MPVSFVKSGVRNYWSTFSDLDDQPNFLDYWIFRKNHVTELLLSYFFIEVIFSFCVYKNSCTIIMSLFYKSGKGLHFSLFSLPVSPNSQWIYFLRSGSRNPKRTLKTLFVSFIDFFALLSGRIISLKSHVVLSSKNRICLWWKIIFGSLVELKTIITKPSISIRLF